MFKPIQAICAFAANYWRSYTSFGQFMLTLAAFAIIVDAAICFKYGISQTFWHGVGFALLAVVIAVLPDAAAQEWDKGAKGSAFGIITGVLLMLPVAYQSHLGYSASVRVGDINLIAHKTEAAANNKDSIEQARKDKAMAESAIARLSWLPTDVTASGIAAEIDTKQEAIRQETKRGGCGPQCLKLRGELAELEKRKGALEDLSKERERLAAANAWLNKAKDKVENSEVAQSAVSNQTKVASQLWNLMSGKSAEDAINPDTVTQTFVNTGIAGANSLAFMLMAPLCWFVAGRNRRKDMPEPTVSVAHSVPASDSTAISIPPLERRFAPPPRQRISTLTVADLLKQAA